MAETPTRVSRAQGARPYYDADALLAVRLDVASPTVSYYGRAESGSLTSAAVWQIKRIDTSAGLVIDWADGNAYYNNVWDDRATLTYR